MPSVRFEPTTFGIRDQRFNYLTTKAYLVR